MLLCFGTILVSLASWFLLFAVFPGLPNRSHECGGGGGRKGREKEAKRQEDVARQREEFRNQANQLLSQVPPNSQEFQQIQELARLGEGDSAQRGAFFTQAPQLVQQFNARVAAGGPATALEARTNLSVEGLRGAAAFRPEEQDVFRTLRGEAPTSDLGRIFQNLVGRAGRDGTGLEAELARALRGQPTTTPLGAQAGRMVDIAGQPPDTAFAEELSLLQDRINREANARGLASSGIPVEQLGRAGVELAVRKASERENIRRTREADVLDLLTRTQQGEQTNLANVQSLFGTGQQLRGREIGVEEAVTNLQAGRESRLTDLLKTQTGKATQNLLDLLSTQTGRAEGLRDLASALREAERQRTEQLVGQLGFAAASGLAGGPVTLAGQTLGSIGQNTFGGGRDPFGNIGLTPQAPTRGRPAGTDVGSLLTAQQTPQGGVAAPDIAETLSRRKKDQGLDQLLKALLASSAGGA